MEDEEKIENDIAEDEREEQETIEDQEKQDDNKDVNDVAEDQREETESVDDLKKVLADKELEINALKEELIKVTQERDEVHNAFLHSGKEPNKERNYESILGDVK